MEKIKKIASDAKNHIMDHKFTYVASALATTAVVLQHRNTKAMYAFLESKGINPMEFYCPEAYEELNK